MFKRGDGTKVYTRNIVTYDDMSFRRNRHVYTHIYTYIMLRGDLELKLILLGKRMEYKKTPHPSTSSVRPTVHVL